MVSHNPIQNIWAHNLIQNIRAHPSQVTQVFSDLPTSKTKFKKQIKKLLGEIKIMLIIAIDFTLPDVIGKIILFNTITRD